MKKLLLVPAFVMALAVTLPAQETAEHKTSEKAENSDEMWKWANFGILAIALAYGMAKGLPPLFRSRTKEIQMGISEAQQMKQDAEKRSAEMDRRLSALGADIENFRKQSAAEMQQEGDRISRETAEQIKKIEQQAAVEIESVGKTARRQLKEYAGELAMGLAEQRLRAKIDGATESALVDDFVRNLERQASQKNGANN